MVHLAEETQVSQHNYEPIFGVLRHMENSAPSLKIFFPDAL